MSSSGYTFVIIINCNYIQMYKAIKNSEKKLQICIENIKLRFGTKIHHWCYTDSTTKQQ